DWAGSASSGDRLTAARLAADLGLPLTRITLSADELLELLDTVLLEGIDWRDFNVHAGLVNAALARGIAQLHASDSAAPVALTGDEIPAYVYDRPKTRAQVGGREDGGVLGLCLDRGIDGQALRARFAALHGITDPALLSRFICGGRYRAALPALGGPT